MAAAPGGQALPPRRAGLDRFTATPLGHGHPGVAGKRVDGEPVEEPGQGRELLRSTEAE